MSGSSGRGKRQFLALSSTSTEAEAPAADVPGALAAAALLKSKVANKACLSNLEGYTRKMQLFG